MDNIKIKTMKLEQAQEMMQYGAPLSVIARTLDLKLSDIIYYQPAFPRD
ncbi:hypothetical protein [Facilibium subflavum]|nr:hypothetical protein [Facilibium subflavum]